MVTMESSWAEVDKQVSSQKTSQPRMSDIVEVYDKKNYESSPKRIRLLGPCTSMATHYVTVDKGKSENGKSSTYSFVTPCCNWNREKMCFEDNGCPYCNLKMKASIKFYQNAIIRDLEDLAPANKGVRSEYEKTPKVFGTKQFFLKENKQTNSYTPVRVVEIPRSLISKLRNIESTNYYMDADGTRKTAPVADLQYGVDLFLFYHPEKKAAEMYDIQRDVDSGKTPIDKEYRKSLLLWNILEVPEVDKEELMKSFDRIATKITNAEDKTFLEPYFRKEREANKEEREAPKTKIISLDDDSMDDIPAEKTKSEPASMPKSEPEPASDDIDDIDEFEDLD